MVMQGEDGRGFLFMKISTDNMVRSPYAIPSCSILHLEKVDLLIIMCEILRPHRSNRHRRPFLLSPEPHASRLHNG